MARERAQSRCRPPAKLLEIGTATLAPWRLGGSMGLAHASHGGGNRYIRNMNEIATKRARTDRQTTDRQAKPAARLRNKVRFITSTSLFDGHDAAINIMRRILQGAGAEVIHLGHNRSVDEVVTAAIQEDVQGIAISSYQGGHVEYFKYAIDLLRARGAGHIKVF